MSDEHNARRECAAVGCPTGLCKLGALYEEGLSGLPQDEQRVSSCKDNVRLLDHGECNRELS